MNIGIRLFGAVLACTAVLSADFSFVETTSLSGGTMTGAMNFAGKFGGGGFKNMQTRVYVSGDVMARIDERTGSIINLRERTVSGVTAKEMILLITAESSEQNKSRSKTMNMATNMWRSTEVAGHQELQDFYRRMSESIAWNPSSPMLASMQQGFEMGESMAKLQEEAAKMDGAMVKQIMRLGGTEEGLEQLTQEDQEKVAAAQQQNGGGSGLMKGALGGLGGFGGRKKRAPEPQPSNGPPTANGAGVLMELTTLYTEFSNAAIAADKFTPAASFKQVESKMLKQMSK